MSRPVAAFGFLLGSTILVFQGLLLLFAWLGFSLGYPLAALQFWLAAAIALTYAGWASKRSYGEPGRGWISRFGLLLLTLFGLFALSIAITGRFYDLSFDGLWYHWSGMLQLLRGWNPIHDPPLHPSQVTAGDLLNQYTKGPWISAVALTEVTDNLEAAKAFNFLLIAAAFGLVITASLSFDHVRTGSALVLAALLAFNPVAIYQSMSFYLDGQLASLLTCLVCLLVLTGRRNDLYLQLPLGAVILVLVNAKLSGLFYASFFCGVYLAWLWATQRVSLKKTVLAASLGLVLGLAAGYNPYVTNTLRGEWSTALQAPDIEANSPHNFRGMNQLAKVLVSTFSRSQLRTENTRLKIPFSVSVDELEAFRYPDPRVSGLGVWFGGIIILMLILLSVELWRRYQQKDDWFKDRALCVVVLIIASALITPGAWWARYAPQLWMAPVFSILFVKSARQKTKLPVLLGYLLAFALCINLVFVALPYVKYQSQASASLRQQLSLLERSDRIVKVGFSHAVGNQYRFDRLGIQYELVIEPECPDPLILPTAARTVVCP